MCYKKCLKSMLTGTKFQGGRGSNGRSSNAFCLSFPQEESKSSNIRAGLRLMVRLL